MIETMKALSEISEGLKKSEKEANDLWNEMPELEMLPTKGEIIQLRIDNKRMEAAITNYCLEYIEEIDSNDDEGCINWFLAEYL